MKRQIIVMSAGDSAYLDADEDRIGGKFNDSLCISGLQVADRTKCSRMMKPRKIEWCHIISYQS